MNKITDWTDQGILPLQDWRTGIEIGRKLAMAGARITRMDDSGSAANIPLEIGREVGKGTIGDVHPWLFLQTASRNKRAMGSYVMGHAAITEEWQSGGATSTMPMRGWFYQADLRYAPNGPLVPLGLPRRVKGQLGTVWPSMRDDGPSTLWIHGDPRLVCPSVSGPYDAATLVCDLQPSMELCMDNSLEPGVGGRHARLQSLARVIAMQPGGSGGAATTGNGLALNLRHSRDGLMGLGMCWITVVGGSPVVTGPTTGPRQQSAEALSEVITGPTQAGEPTTGFGSGIEWGAGTESGEDLGRRPNEYGRFQLAAESGAGVALPSARSGARPR